MVIDCKVNGLKNIQDKLSKEIQKLQDLTPFWQTVGSYVQRQTIKERFNKEQSPEGKKWKPLSEATKSRRKKKGSYKILTDTGDLRRSINFKASRDNVLVGSNLKYARVHQLGSKKIPARPYLGINEKDCKHIAQMLKIYIEKHV